MPGALNRRRAPVLLLLAVLTLVATMAPAAAQGAPWLLVDTRKAVLSVIRDGRVEARFPGIAIGRGGVARLRLRDDNATPLGTFHIAWINDHSVFHRFFGFNYPTPPYVWRAFDHNLIGPETVRRILWAVHHHRLPPQDTPLGGDLGIHGLGHGDPWVHRRINWTGGCIALTNAQIDRLARWVRIGTKVVVR
ncbi:MAG TPA: L,D-transpeptidase [Chromatiales bacterium]|nr:L,D-transpeptidase [Chromatiales bacterium]